MCLHSLSWSSGKEPRSGLWGGVLVMQDPIWSGLEAQMEWWRGRTVLALSRFGGRLGSLVWTCWIETELWFAWSLELCHCDWNGKQKS